MGSIPIQKEVTGRVLDKHGKPIIGATVAVKGMPKGSITDDNGLFYLADIPENAILYVSFVGYNAVELPITKSKMDVILQDDNVKLDELVITGYGNFSKSSFTGSASTIKTDMMKNMPTISVEQKLQGMTSGISITSSSGQPGSTSSIRIRGMGSFNASNEPLYVIDGVPVITGNASTIAGKMNNAGNSLMNTVNPADIENITVVKDAAAASLYGSRAANGVIIITTKKGKAGKTTVNFKADMGFSNFATPFRPIMGGAERREILLEGLVNSGLDGGKEYDEALSYANAEIDKYAPTPWSGYTDWRDVIFRNGRHQNYELSASGGNGGTSYYASFGYTKQDGTVYNSSLDRYTGRVNVTQKIKTRGEIGANVMVSQVNEELHDERTSFDNPFFSMAAMVTPSNAIYNPDGTYATSFPGYGKGANPKLKADLNYNRSRLSRMMGTAHAAIDIVDGLTLKEVLSYDYSIAKDAQYFHPLSTGEYHGLGYSAKGFNEYGKVVSSTSLGYSKTFKAKHSVDALVAYEVENYKNDFANGGRSNFPSDQMQEPDNGSNITGFNSSSSQSKMISYISRANYSYGSRYYLAASFRRDGSSRLAPSGRWGNFWSASGMWHIANEGFMRSTTKILSDLKVRASYGVNGNQPGGLYGYMGLYSYGLNYGGLPGSYESSIPNPNLTWETNHTMNLGLEFALYNRVNVSLEYYTRRTKDLLFNVPISTTNGFSSYLANVGEIDNKGVELEIRSTNIAKKNFSWNTVLNLSHNRNRILELDGSQGQIVQNSWFIRKKGMPFNTFYVREFAGVDPETGDGLYYTNTLNADGSRSRDITTDPNKAQQIAYKSADPKVAGGITNMFQYKQIDLSFTFTYALGGYSIDKTATWMETDGEVSQYSRNIPAYYADRWQKPGDITDIPRFVFGQSYGGGGNIATSRRVHSTDHLRLKNLTVGYSLPHHIVSKVGLERAKIFFGGTNLLTWAAYKGYDPEVPVNGEMNCEAPPLRTFTFGIELGL